MDGICHSSIVYRPSSIVPLLEVAELQSHSYGT